MRETLRATYRVVRAGHRRARWRVLRDGAAATRAAALAAGLTTGVLPTLERRPLHVDSLAAQVGAVDTDLLSALLRALAANDLVTIVDGRWGITRSARDVLTDPVARAGAAAYGGFHTDLYRGLPEQLAGGPARTDVEDGGAPIAVLSEAFRPFVEEHVRSTTHRLSPTRVIDVGCGSGALLRAALQAAPVATGLGIDADAGAVALAERTLASAGLGGRSRVLRAEATDLAASAADRGDPADLLMLANVVYYVPAPDRVRFLRLLAGLIRPGGTLLLVTTAAEDDAFACHFDLLLRAQGQGMSLPDVDHLADQLAEAGLDLVERRRLAPGVPLHALTAVSVGAVSTPPLPVPFPPKEAGMAADLHLTGDDAADGLLSDDPLALLLGMLLDQQVPMETAFAGPAKLRDRLGGLEAAAIAEMDPDALEDACRVTPAVHRYPGVMAKRIQALCATLVDEYDGDAAAVWTSGRPDGRTVLRRLKALPGFGGQKARVFLALLGKQLGLAAPGWREAAGPYGEDGVLLSVADVVDTDSLAQVREAKRAARAAAKG